MTDEPSSKSKLPPDPIPWPGRSADADHGYGERDPMKIFYLLVMDDENPEGMTVFQGFGRGWQPLQWALAHLPELPSNVLEPTWPLEKLISQRMGGANHQTWSPLMISALEQLMLDELGFCVVVMTGTASSALRVSEWIKKQPRPVLHVTSVQASGAISTAQFDFEALHAHCRQVYDRHSNEISPDRAASAQAALQGWHEREPIRIKLDELGHNCVTPNHLVLRRAGRSLGEQHPHWMSLQESEYTRVIVESARAVLEVRDSIPKAEWRRLIVGSPAIILTELSTAA